MPKPTLRLLPARKRDADIYYAPIHLMRMHHMSRLARTACHEASAQYVVVNGKVVVRQ